MVKRAIITIAITLSLYRYSWGQISNFATGCFQGLNDTDSPATIGDCEAQSALNVESNKTGTAIFKRKGYSREANLTITTSPVTGSHSFLTDAGDKLDIVCNDRQCSQSVNGGAYTIFLNTATAGVTRWSLVDVDGDLYGANDARDTVFKYNGTTLLYSTGIPHGSILELTQDRLVAADTSANPNRGCYSASGAFENFDTALANESAWCDDLGSPGDRVTGLKYDAGILYIFKTHSINACEVDNQYNTRCTVLASYVGTRDPASIISTTQGVMFKGDDGHFWIISNGKLTNTSKKISSLMNSQASGSQRNNTTNGSADWEASTHSMTGYWDTQTVPGSIFSSSNAVTDTDGIDWASGTLTNISTSDILGAISISDDGLEDTFSDGDFVTNNIWTQIVGDWSVVSDKLYHGGSLGILSSSQTVPYGQYSFLQQVPSDRQSNPYIDFISDIQSCNSSANKYTHSYIVSAYPYTSAAVTLKKTGTTISGCSYSFANDGAEHLFSIYRSSGGIFTMYADNVIKATCVDSSINTSNFMCLNTALSYVYYDDIVISGYNTSGSIVSRIFDSKYDSPVWGILSATSSIVSGKTAIYFYTRTSTASDGGGFSEFLSSSDTLKIQSPNRRFIQYKAVFSTSISTETPSLSSISLLSATTGVYISQCIQPGTNISAWGIFSCAETKTGAGGLTYYVRVGTTCTSLSTGTWTAQTNNATVGVPYNPAFQFRFDSLLGSATDQAQVDACTVYWNEGSVSPPTWGVYDSANNNAYFAIATDNATANNKFLRFDMDLYSWIPWDLPITAPLYKDHYLFFGSAGGGYWNKYGLTDSDNGTDINSHWKSKDWGGGDPFQEKNFQAVSSVVRNQIVGSLDMTYIDSQGNTGTYTINTGTDSTKPYIRNNYALPVLSPSTFLNLQFGNNSARFWEVDGYRLDYSILPWRPIDQ